MIMIIIKFQKDSSATMTNTTPSTSSRRQLTINAERIASQELLAPGKELVIVHNQREYKLRITSNGKLILTA